jgi:hypothetical protein
MAVFSTQPRETQRLVFPPINTPSQGCLKGLISLKVLGLNNTQITDAGLQDLKKSLPQCNIRK